MVQSFREQSFRGVSFRGQDLTGADFSGADLRGANFSDAVLVGANFSQSICGQQNYWISSILGLSIALAMLAGLLVSYASMWVGALLVAPETSDLYNRALYFRVSSLVTLLILLISSWVIIRRGTGTTFSVLATAFVIAIAFTLWLGEGEALAALILQAIALATILASVSVGALAVAIASCTKPKLVLPLISGMTCLAIFAGVSESLEFWHLTATTRWIAFSIGGLITLSALGLSTYIGYEAVSSDSPKYRFICFLSLKLSSFRGTQFSKADLTEADFTQANLQRANFQKATLIRTCWFEAHNLNRAYVTGTYLEDPKIRSLVITRQGQGKNYDRLDLSRLNLQGASFQNSSCIGVDFSGSDLRQVNFSAAKLAQTQLFSCDLSGACLTGTYIENWGISTDTQFSQVRCDYVYMRLPTQQDPDPCRKPDNRDEVFKLGDFEDFITPIVKTLDLYQQQNVDFRDVAETFRTLDLFHYEGIDPTAAALALQQLSNQHPEAGLEVIALEGRGQQKIRLQAKVSSQVNRSQLSEQYFATYGRFRNLSYADLQALLAGVAEKDEQLRKLEGLLNKAIEQPKFYVETYQNQGEFVMSQSKGNINIGDVQGNVSGLAAAGESQTITGATLGEVSGQVTNTINQLSESPIPESEELKELLLRLTSAIEAETALEEDDKIEAVKQVEILAEAGKQPEDGALKRAAKTAMKVLKGTTAGLSETNNLFKEVTALLPAIATLLALV